MKLHSKVVLAAAILTVSVLGGAPPAYADAPPPPRVEASTGIQFPGEVTLEGQSYRLRGVALRRVNILFVSIDVYAIGYYVSASDDRLKAFRLVAAREMSRPRIVKALTEAFEKKLGGTPDAAKPLLNAVADSPKGEVTHYYAAKPGELTMQQGKHAPVVVRDAVVTDAIFDQWISPKYAVSKEMQKALTGS